MEYLRQSPKDVNIRATTAVEKAQNDAAANLMNKRIARRTKQRSWDEAAEQKRTAAEAQRTYSSPLNKHRYVWVLLIAGIAMTVGPLTVYALRVGVVLSLNAIGLVVLVGMVTGALIAVLMREHKNIIGWMFIGVLTSMSITIVLLSVVLSAVPATN